MSDKINVSTIGQKIKMIRELKGYSQDYMANMLNITQNTFSKIERGESNLSLDKAIEICNVLEIDINTLLNFDEKQVFNHCSQSGNFGNNNTFNLNSIEKIQDLYERIIKAKDEEIDFLRNRM
jgi:transcriptional regulator with XRE-family HTH domain